MDLLTWPSAVIYHGPVGRFYAKGINKRVYLMGSLDTIIIPLGSVRLDVSPNAKPHEIGIGSLMYVPAAVGTQIDFVGTFNVMVVNVCSDLRKRFQLQPQLLQNPLAPRIQVVNNPQQINAIVHLIRRISSAEEIWALSCMRCIAQLLLWEIALSKVQMSKTYSACRRGLDASKVRLIDRFVDENIEQSLSLDQLAQQVDMSRFHFLRSFKEATGLSPLQYIIVKRVERARDMLRGGQESIAEIAYATGFSSQSHLTRVFKRHFGLTPGVFKREHRLVW